MPSERLFEALAVSLTLLGCSSETCGGAACVPPITIRASISEPGVGPLHVTLCKGSACESADFDPRGVGARDTTGVFDLRVGAESLTDAGGVGLVVTVLRATDLTDGEPLHLTVETASGQTVRDWSAPAAYKRSEINGGCDTCSVMQVTTSG